MENQELSWKKTTLDLFIALPRNIRNTDVAKATGLSVAWITDFTKGKIKEPSVDKVNKLYIYLKSVKK